ncbi:MAG TPA: cation-transporting P-type ATPase [Gaiellaceae bacterium]|nr:cation-transporting P-type ATPase [Gaiellaceae bacterium]
MTSFHAVPAHEVARELASEAERGLTESEARDRLERSGPNALERASRPPYLKIAARQLNDPLVGLLLCAAAVSAFVGEPVEAAIIAAIVVLNGALGFAEEIGAERAVLALRESVVQQITVVREGLERLVAAETIVPGDLLVLREGDRIPADTRLVAGEGLAVDEAPLTGESVPVEKSVEAVDAEAPLAERASMVYAGTAVTRGRARGLVTATGAETELGRIAHLTTGAKPPATPLQNRINGLARIMAAVGVVITVLLGAAMLLRGSPLHEAFLVGVSVAVAAVPEGLAATVTIALALGARAMAGRGAIVRRLAAVETLGSATVIAADKTGTLTENELQLVRVSPADGFDEEQVLTAALLASTAQVIEDADGTRVAGDPIDAAILVGAGSRGISAEEGHGQRALVREIPFDARRRRMTLVYREGNTVRVYSKGAPEAILERSARAGEVRPSIAERAEEWAQAGLRVLAVAARELDEAHPETDDELEAELVPLGLVALQDPLRASAPGAIAEAQRAGLRVEMLTGDHPLTAEAIGRSLNLAASAVHARVTPEEKFRLVELRQSEGEVVAVTGDGVNDAPALRQADVGVAMGRTGTEAAREAADLVLTNDDFATIVAAIREGRAITDNIRKFVAFLVSANLGEVVLFAIAIGAGLGTPLNVVQVLLVNVLTDGLPAIALARDPPSAGTMRRPPERSTRLFPRLDWIALGIIGMLVGLAGLAAFLIGPGGDAAQTRAFATIALAELVLVFSVRSRLEHAWREPRNPYLFGGVVVSAVIVAVALYVPWARDALDTVALDLDELGVAAGFALVPAVGVELLKGAVRRGWLPGAQASDGLLARRLADDEH